jgi:WD40 repeat protein
MNLYCGGNKFANKIDLISDKKTNIKINEKSVVSCFDFNFKNNFYVAGTYSNSVFLMDYRSDKSFGYLDKFHTGGINQLKFCNINTNLLFTGARKDNQILLWDCRKVNQPLNSFYKNNSTNQKINFTIDHEDKYLFTGCSDGTIIIYEINSYKVISYFYANEDCEAISSVDFNNENKYLISSSGKRHFVNKKNINVGEGISTNNFDLDEEEINDIYKESSFKIWDLKLLF